MTHITPFWLTFGDNGATVDLNKVLAFCPMQGVGVCVWFDGGAHFAYQGADAEALLARLKKGLPCIHHDDGDEHIPCAGKVS